MSNAIVWILFTLIFVAIICGTVLMAITFPIARIIILAILISGIGFGLVCSIYTAIEDFILSKK